MEEIYVKPPRKVEDVRCLIGDRLKEARVQAGLSQGQVAKLTKLDQAKISRIEMGGFLTANNIQRLAMLYHVSIDWLFGLRDEKPLPTRLVNQISKLPVGDRLKLIALLRSMP